MDENNRKCERIEKPFVLRFRIKPSKLQEADSVDWGMVAVKDESDGNVHFQNISDTYEWDMVTVNDLSEGGVFFQYKMNFRVGATLELKFNVTPTTPTICCEGLIIRSTKIENSPLYRTAITFANISEEIKETLKKAFSEITSLR